MLMRFLCFLIAVAASVAPCLADSSYPTPQVSPAAVPVLLDGEPVLIISTGIHPFTPGERAQTISKRLVRISADPSIPTQLITVVDYETTSDIVLQDMVLMTVTEADAAAYGKLRRATASEYAELIRAAVETYRESRSSHSRLVASAKALAATAVLLLLLFLIKRCVPWLAEAIKTAKGTRIRTIRLQSIELLHEERIVALLLSCLRFGRLLLIVGLLYLYIPLVLSFFPLTRGMAVRLFDYIETPVVNLWQAFVSYLPNVFFLLVISVCTHYVIRFTRFIFAEVERQNISLPGFYPDWAIPSFKIIRFLIIVFAVVVAFPYLPGSDSPAFKGVSVFLGVLLSLGSTSAVANVVAGAILTYMRAFTVGDRVKIADTSGDITEKNLLVTRIRSSKNVDITIPNSMVLGSHIINYSSSSQLILHTTVTIGYDVPWRQVHALLIAAAEATDRIIREPAPFVLQTALNDFYVSYELNAYTDAPSNMASIYSELHTHIQDQFNTAGVEIMSPHYAALRDGNPVTIPPDYLPSDYRPPAHRVSRVEG